MRTIVRQEDIVPTDRFFYISVFLVVTTAVLLLRLWYLQIYKAEYYAAVSDRNRIRKIDNPAPRGTIFDRNGKSVLSNFTSYDLVIVPQYTTDRETTFKVISRLLHIAEADLEKSARNAAGLPKYMPVTLKRNLTVHEVATVESNRIFLPGIEVRAVPRREYTPDIPVHMIGYLAEVDPSTLEAQSKLPELQRRYLPGDLVGKQGLEARWESHLRGQNGYKLLQVDAFGRQVDSFRDSEDLKLPVQPAKKGNDIELTIDWDLQRAAAQAFKGKYGAVVVLNPQTGEILALVSEPGYDPAIYQQSVSADEWNALINNPFKPLFDKTTGGEYIPGSIYKSLVAIAALEEGVIDTNTAAHCNGKFVLGDQVFQCWEKGGHGRVTLREALMKSCDVYFYQVGVELGVDRIAKYAKMFGLGSKFGVNLNMERPGLVPTSAWKKQTFGLPWAAGDTPNIAIGQGYNLLTPVQMAVLYAAIANGGYLWRPFLVRSVTNLVGEVVKKFEPELMGKVDGVKPETLKLIRELLGNVVMDPHGTGRNAAVPGVTVAGKTGSAQVVSLKRNANNKNDDVSVKWKEHAIFSAFSPVENAEIALAIVSENDAIGGGGAQAAPVAGKILDFYYKKKNGNGLPANPPLAKKPDTNDTGESLERQE